jgi:hypothetical protein
VIEVVVAFGGAVFMVVGVVLALAEGSSDERRHERWRRTRHVRTLEQELGLEPYPLGPLDAPYEPTASPVVPTEGSRAWNRHATPAEVYRAQLLREIRRDG